MLRSVLIVAVLALMLSAGAFAQSPARDSRYPPHWWAAVSKDGAPSWEVLTKIRGELQAPTPSTAPPAPATLTVPSGFAISVYASGLQGARLMAVSLNGRGQAYAVGAFGTVLRSTDGGQAWQPVAIDWTGIGEGGAEPHLYDVHVGDEGTVTIVGEFGVILRSTDGVRWQVVHRGEQSLFGLAQAGDGSAYAVGQAGTVLASTDGGASWRRIDSRLVTQAWHQAVAAARRDGEGAATWRVMTAGAAGTLLELAP